MLKDAGNETIRAAVAAVARGEAVYGPRVADRVVSAFAAVDAKASQAFPQLTTREREVLDLIARGPDNASIAHRLVLSEKTFAQRLQRPRQAPGCRPGRVRSSPHAKPASAEGPAEGGMAEAGSRRCAPGLQACL